MGPLSIQSAWQVMDFREQRDFAEKVSVFMRPEVCRPASDLFKNGASKHGKRPLACSAVKRNERGVEFIRPQGSRNSEQGRYPTASRFRAFRVPVCIYFTELTSRDTNIGMRVKIFAQHAQGVRLEHVVMIEEEQINRVRRTTLRSQITCATGPAIGLSHDR